MFWVLNILDILLNNWEEGGISISVIRGINMDYFRGINIALFDV
tara:strand:- start:22 stop:153 length:132 start_codon:yes stop_codon:yes gene_type:complete